MKKMYRYCLMLCISGVMIAFAGCNKLEEYIENNPLATYDQCRVTSMTYSFLSNVIGVTINYNSFGDPISVIQTQSGTGHPDGHFRYDNKRRLKDYIGMYGNGGGFEFWHKYFYDNKGRVVRDTTYTLGNIVNDAPADYYGQSVTTYEYDQYGRISYTRHVWLDTPEFPFETIYTYDAKGNLVKPGLTYDDKISINRTHRVWMFITRNYSLNNAWATAWNDDKLPTAMTLNSEGGNFAGFYYGNLDGITYQCKGDSPF
jgi:hypothetical protein